MLQNRSPMGYGHGARENGGEGSGIERREPPSSLPFAPSLLRYLLLDYQFCFSKACKTQSFIFPEEICVSRRNFGLLPDNLSLSLALIPIASIYYLKFYTLLEFLMLIIFTIYIRWIWKYNLYKINKYLS